MVIRDEDAGMVVTCVEYCAPGFKYRRAGSGRVSTTLVPAWATDDPDGVRSIRAAASLMRIDGGEPETIEDEEYLGVSA